MNKLKIRVQSRMRTLTIGRRAGNNHRFFADMTIDEFLQETDCLEHKETLEGKGGLKNLTDIPKYCNELLKACELPAIPAARFSEGAKLLGRAIEKNRMRPPIPPPEDLDDSAVDDALNDALSGLNGATAAAIGMPSPSSPGDSGAYSNADATGYPNAAGHADYADADPAGYADADLSTNGVQPAYEDPNDMNSPDWGTPINNDVPALPPKASAAASGDPASDADYHDYEDPADMGDLYEDPDAALSSSQGPPPVQRRAPASLPANVLPGVAMAVPADNRRRRPQSASIVPEQAPLPADYHLWTCSEVIRWLKECELGEYKDIFYSNGFEGPRLHDLKGSDFRGANFDADRCDALGAALDILRNKGYSGGSSSGASPTPATARTSTSSAGGSASGSMKKAKAVYAYNADKSSHLTVALDEVVTVIDDKKSWWLVRNAQGREGKVPSNYMELTSGSEATMEGEPWFHGDIVDRTVAERRLSSCADSGTFLVRRSGSDANAYTLSIRAAASVIHLKIQNVGSRYSLGQGSNESFANIPELVQYHRTNEIKVAHREHLCLRFECPRH